MAAKLARPTVPVSVCFKPGVRETLARLITARKLSGAQKNKPRSIVQIVDDAITNLAAQRNAGRKINYIAVPASECDKISIRVAPSTYEVAQTAAAEDDVRNTDFIRTALAFYLRKHEREIIGHRRTRRS
jgi:hypothetical protein